MQQEYDMPAGRPKIDLSVLPDGWHNEILELYSQGGADIEVKAMIGGWLGTFSHDLFERWINEEEEFSETIKYGRLMSEAWWNQNGRVNLKSKEFNYTGWYMQMKNRFGWADKQETKQDVNIKSVNLKDLVKFE